MIDIEVDKLTNSIVNRVSGDSFATDILPITKVELKKITKKNAWNFNWVDEFKKSDRVVYKLTIIGNPDIIQGLASIRNEKTITYYI